MPDARRCGYTVIDAAGEEQPCDHPKAGWRWYQDVRDHGDCLEPACSVHMNEGGGRMHAAETQVAAVRALLDQCETDPDTLCTCGWSVPCDCGSADLGVSVADVRAALDGSAPKLTGEPQR